MEKACLINSVDQLELIPPGATRLYFGSECCEKLFPTAAETLKLIGAAKEKGVDISIVTPHSGSRGLGRVKKTLIATDEKLDSYEIIINDFGVLQLIETLNLKGTRVWGRLFQNQVKGGGLQEFIKQFRISRVEFDRLTDIPEASCSVSIYYPFSLVAKTRYCVHAGTTVADGNINCRRECRSVLYEAMNSNLLKPTRFKGNAQFIELNPDLNHPTMKTVDRLVFQPDFPV